MRRSMSVSSDALGCVETIPIQVVICCWLWAQISGVQGSEPKWPKQAVWEDCCLRRAIVVR